MLILIRWPKGSFKADVSSNDYAGSILNDISRKYSMPLGSIELYRDFQLHDKIDSRKTLFEENISNGQILYLKCDCSLPKVDICQMSSPADMTERFFEKGEKVPESLDRIRKEFGPRAVTAAFFEHEEMKLPSIDYQDESSCYAIRVGKEALVRFQNYAFQTGFSTHRVIFLFGRVDTIKGKVTVHCSYEPEQENYDTHFKISDSFNVNSALRVASAFGMQCIGMAISHQSNPQYPLSEYMIKLAALYQNLYGEYFTTLVVTPRGDSETEVVAFQITDAAMKIQKMDLFDFSLDQKRVYFKRELRVFGKKSRYADVNLFLCAVRVRLTNSKFPSHSFPSQPSLIDISKHLFDNEYYPEWLKFFDFNLLVFLVNERVIMNENELNSIVAAILTKSKLPEEIMNSVNLYTNK